MKNIDISIRYYRDYPEAYDYGYETLTLPFEQSAFLLVDVDGKTPNATTENFIAPTLAAARDAQMHVAYVHNDLRLVADPGNIVGEIWGRTKGAEGPYLDYWNMQDYHPEYLDCVAPQEK